MLSLQSTFSMQINIYKTKDPFHLIVLPHIYVYQSPINYLFAIGFSINLRNNTLSGPADKRKTGKEASRETEGYFAANGGLWRGYWG